MKKIIFTYYNVFFMSILLFVGCNSMTYNKNSLDEYGLKGKVKTIRQNIYDVEEKFGQVVKGKKKDQHLITFDENGNEVNYIFYDSNGNKESEKIHKYDDEDKLVEYNYYSNGDLKSKDLFEYNIEGIQVEVKQYDNYGSLTGKIIPKYDDNGNKVERNFYSSNGDLKTKYTFKYDKDGYPIEVNSYDSDGSLINRIKSKYDDGKLVEMNYDDNESITESTTFEYELDKNNNWIIQISYVDGIPRFITERTFEYY